jgi:geranylgeranyl transferase type-1 subunit beta
MGNLDEGILNKDQLVQWCLFRQIGGFQGRPNKLQDVCYGFWIGASLAMLDSFHLANSDALKDFLLQSESRIGGFAKDPESFPGNINTHKI